MFILSFHAEVILISMSFSFNDGFSTVPFENPFRLTWHGMETEYWKSWMGWKGSWIPLVNHFLMKIFKWVEGMNHHHQHHNYLKFYNLLPFFFWWKVVSLVLLLLAFQRFLFYFDGLLLFLFCFNSVLI